MDATWSFCRVAHRLARVFFFSQLGVASCCSCSLDLLQVRAKLDRSEVGFFCHYLLRRATCFEDILVQRESSRSRITHHFACLFFFAAMSLVRAARLLQQTPALRVAASQPFVTQQRYASKRIDSGIEARKQLLSGINQLAEAVSATLGPKVCLHRLSPFPNCCPSTNNEDVGS